MIATLTILLLFQLGGEVLARAFGLPLPGPVIGIVGLFGLLLLQPTLAQRMAETANALLAHLSLLFVPAGVGVVQHLDTFGDKGPALLAALAVSTALAILVAAGSFLLVARLTEAADD